MSINNLKEATNHNHDLLIDRFMESNVAINNHNDKEDKVSGLVFFVEAEDPEYQIVPCGYYLDTRYFSLNPVKVDKNNMLRICTWSVAGCVVNSGDIQRDIDKYNESVTLSDRFKIKYVLMTDGTIYEGIN